MWVLKHIANLAVKPELGTQTVIFAVNQNPALCGLKKPAQKIYQRRFSCSRFSYDCNIGSCRYVEIKVLQNRCV